MADFDAVVVGGGVNGLAAALRLVESGWSVLLAEANAELGGAVRTVESTLPGFRHDFGAAFFALASVAPAIGGRDLSAEGLRFVHAPVAAAHPFHTGQAVTLGRSAEQTAASVGRVCAADGRAWLELDAQFGSAMLPFLRAQLARWPLREGLGLLRGLGSAANLLEFARVVLSGAETVAGRFVSEQARCFFTAPGLHADLGPEQPVTGVYSLLLGMLGQRLGMPVAAGGAGAITTAMAARLTRLGAVISTGQPVTRLMVRGGRAVGVEIDRQPVTVDRAVIACIDPDLVVALTGPEMFPASALRQVRRFRRGTGTFKVDWALAGQVPWTAEPCRSAGVVHLGESMRAMSRAAWEARHGMLPTEPTLILGQQSLADPSRAPAGRHTLWGYTRVPATLTHDADGREVTGWEAVAQSFADRIEAQIEQYAPGFTDRILRRRIWTPNDLQTADTNLIGGDITSGSFALDQQLIFRPGPAWWRWGSPIAGLYLGCAALPPGAGVHGACGDLAAIAAVSADRRYRLQRVLTRPRLGIIPSAGAGARQRTGT